MAEEKTADVQNESVNDTQDAGLKQTDVNSEKQSSENQYDYEGIVTGWKEDRTRLSELERENLELKRKLSSSSAGDEDEDLSFEERYEQRRKREEQEQYELREHTKRQAEREADFMRKTNPTFRKHEKTIIQLAIDGKMNLSEATKAFIARNSEMDEAKASLKEKSKDAGKTTPEKEEPKSKGYDPEKDKDKSIEDIYRDEL